MTTTSIDRDDSEATEDRGRTTETVYQKGVRLFLAGRVRRVRGDLYEVRGDTGTHEVDDRKRLCGCASRVYCSHRAAVEIAVARLNAETARKLEAQRAGRPNRVKFSVSQMERNLSRMEA